METADEDDVIAKRMDRAGAAYQRATTMPVHTSRHGDGMMHFHE